MQRGWRPMKPSPATPTGLRRCRPRPNWSGSGATWRGDSSSNRTASWCSVACCRRKNSKRDRLSQEVGAQNEPDEGGRLVVLGGGQRQGPHRVPSREIRRRDENRAHRQAKPRTTAMGFAQKPRVRTREANGEYDKRGGARDAEVFEPVWERETGFVVRVARERAECVQPPEAVAPRRKRRDNHDGGSESGVAHATSSRTRLDHAEGQKQQRQPF